MRSILEIAHSCNFAEASGSSNLYRLDYWLFRILFSERRKRSGAQSFYWPNKLASCLKLRVALCLITLLISANWAGAQYYSESAPSDPPSVGVNAAPRQETATSNGAFTENVRIDVPAYHDIQPNISLSYSSEANLRMSTSGAGLTGFGWILRGVPSIRRITPRGGTPNYDSNDTFMMDGEEMVACSSAISSPSCQAGGTHAMRYETYQKIVFDQTNNTWRVWDRNGRVSTFRAIGGGTPSTFVWMVDNVQDTHGNQVNYTYVCEILPSCRIDAVQYNGSTIKFYWELRSDPITFATGAGLTTLSYRIRSIDILTSGSRVRAYALTYEQDPASGVSRLITVREFGRDAVLDATGLVNLGTSLPPRSFTYGSNLPSLSAVVQNWDVDSLTDLSKIGVPPTYLPDFVHRNGYSTSRLFSAFKDFDGSGRTSFIQADQIISWGMLYGENWLYDGAPYCYRVLLSGPHGITGYKDIACAPYYMNLSFTFGDILGNGKAGVLWQSANLGLGYSLGGGWDFSGSALPSNYQANLMPTPFYVGQGSYTHRQFLGDFDGSGSTSLMTVAADVGSTSVPGRNGPQITVDHKDGSRSIISQTDFPMCTTAFPMDIRGDGKTNLVFQWFGTDLAGNKFDNVCRYYLAIAPYYSAVSGLEGSGLNLQILNTSNNKTFVSEPRFSDSSVSLPFKGSWLDGADRRWLVGDFNGDGAQDLALVTFTKSTFSVDVFLSTGSGFVHQVWVPPTAFAGWKVSCDSATGGNEGVCLGNDPVAVVDVDGDGRTDIAIEDVTGNTTILQSTGTGFHVMPGSVPGDPIGDLLGNGRPAFKGANISTIAISGAFPNVMISSTNSYGGTVRANYTPSTSWSGNQMPFVLQTLSSIVTDDGRGGQSSWSYSYGNGKWDNAERRFLGFKNVTVAKPCNAGETNCPSTQYVFNQSRAAVGQTDSVIDLA